VGFAEMGGEGLRDVEQGPGGFVLSNGAGRDVEGFKGGFSSPGGWWW
jgi:hypothetical protein